MKERESNGKLAYVACNVHVIVSADYNVVDIDLYLVIWLRYPVKINAHF